MCVCMFACLHACLDRPHTINFKWAQINISRRLDVLVHYSSVESDSVLRPLQQCSNSAALACEMPGAKTAEVEARMASCVLTCTNPSALWWHFVGDYTQMVRTVGEIASGKGHAQTTQYTQYSAHELGVKLSSCMCSRSSSVLTDSIQSQTLLLFMVCVPDTNHHNVLLAQARPRMLKHLLVVKRYLVWVGMRI